jgi:hypothetical protein
MLPRIFLQDCQTCAGNQSSRSRAPRRKLHNSSLDDSSPTSNVLAEGMLLRAHKGDPQSADSKSVIRSFHQASCSINIRKISSQTWKVYNKDWRLRIQVSKTSSDQFRFMMRKLYLTSGSTTLVNDNKAVIRLFWPQIHEESAVCNKSYWLSYDLLDHGSPRWWDTEKVGGFEVYLADQKIESAFTTHLCWQCRSQITFSFVQIHSKIEVTDGRTENLQLDIPCSI